MMVTTLAEMKSTPTTDATESTTVEMVSRGPGLSSINRFLCDMSSYVFHACHHDVMCL